MSTVKTSDAARKLPEGARAVFFIIDKDADAVAVRFFDPRQPVSGASLDKP